MKQVPDRKKLRREYLRKKAGAYSDVAIYAVLCMPALFLTVCSGAFVVLHIVISHDWPSVVGMTLTTAFFGLLTWYCRRRLRESQDAASAVPYAPPVTPNTLPAKEILVRGAEEMPVAQSEVLLRAVKEQETPKEELLRVSQEG